MHMPRFDEHVWREMNPLEGAVLVGLPEVLFKISYKLRFLRILFRAIRPNLVRVAQLCNMCEDFTKFTY